MDQDSYVVAAGAPWPCDMPSHNGEVTRVVIVGFPEASEANILARLDLPGVGQIGICTSDNSQYFSESHLPSLQTQRHTCYTRPRPLSCHILSCSLPKYLRLHPSNLSLRQHPNPARYQVHTPHPIPRYIAHQHPILPQLLDKPANYVKTGHLSLCVIQPNHRIRKKRDSRNS